MKYFNSSWMNPAEVVRTSATEKVKELFLVALTDAQFTFVYKLSYGTFTKPVETQEDATFILDSYAAAYNANTGLSVEQEKALLEYLLKELQADYRRFYNQWVTLYGGES